MDPIRQRLRNLSQVDPEVTRQVRLQSDAQTLDMKRKMEQRARELRQQATTKSSRAASLVTKAIGGLSVLQVVAVTAAVTLVFNPTFHTVGAVDSNDTGHRWATLTFVPVLLSAALHMLYQWLVLEPLTAAMVQFDPSNRATLLSSDRGLDFGMASPSRLRTACAVVYAGVALTALALLADGAGILIRFWADQMNTERWAMLGLTIGSAGVDLLLLALDITLAVRMVKACNLVKQLYRQIRQESLRERYTTKGQDYERRLGQLNSRESLRLRDATIADPSLYQYETGGAQKEDDLKTESVPLMSSGTQKNDETLDPAACGVHQRSHHRRPHHHHHHYRDDSDTSSDEDDDLFSYTSRPSDRY